MAQTQEHPRDPSRRASARKSGGPPTSGKQRVARPPKVPLPTDAADEEPGGDPLVALVKAQAKANGPWFALSLVFHIVLLVVFGFMAFRPEKRKGPGTMISGFNTNLGDRQRQRKIIPVQIGAVKNDEPDDLPRAKKTAKKTETPAEAPAPIVKRPSEVNVSGALASRGVAGGTGTGGAGGAGGRGGGQGGGGGTEQSESAVSRGLAWIARQQQSDGHWELHQGYPDAGQLRTSTGATALALLALQGAGHTHREGPYKDKVGKGLKWLVGAQKKTGALKGDFYDYDREGDAASFYSHGQATIALCEAYGMTQDQDLLQPILEGLTFIYEAQHPQTGGWKYRRRSEGDLSVFGWQIMAMQTARMAGIDVPQEVLERAAKFLDLVQEQDGSRYRYELNETKSPTPAMTAEGLLCRQYLGWPRDHPAMLSGVNYLLEPENLPSWASSRRNIYHWYYAAQVLHNLGGPEWEKFNDVLREELVKSQVKGGGKVGGSWHPSQPPGAIDENADKGGRLYVTCLCLLTLEVYYRHLPLYRDVAAEAATGP